MLGLFLSTHFQYNIQVLHGLYSDHFPIMLTFDSTRSSKPLKAILNKGQKVSDVFITRQKDRQMGP